jgi:hypothetical protein
MANQYKRPDSVEDYLRDARTGHTAPFNTSHGMRHDPAGRKGQTVLATGAVNNVGRSCLNIENSLLDEKFGGGVTFDELDVLERDTARSQGREDPDPLTVHDEVGDHDRQRRTAPGFEANGHEQVMNRGFIAARFK